MKYLFLSTFYALLIVLATGSLLAQTTNVMLPDCNNCDPEIATLDCAGATFNNTEFVTGEEFQASMMVPYTGGNGQPAGVLSLTSTGVTGLTADLVGQTLMSGAGNLIFYVHGTPSGAGTASFDITFSGQTCTVDLVLTEAPTGTSAAGEHGLCSPLYTARDIHADRSGVITYVDAEGYIWVEAENTALRGGGKLFAHVGESLAQTGGNTHPVIPERVRGPYYGTAGEIKFNKVIAVLGAINGANGNTFIVAEAEDGNTWAFSGSGSTQGGEAINGDIFCKNCTGDVSDSDFSTTSPGVGWARLTNNTGDNIIDVAIIDGSQSNGWGNTIVLDENGAVWVTNEAASVNTTAGGRNKLSGLGSNYSRGTNDPSYLPITIPNGELITKIIGYYDGTRGVMMALSQTGKIYAWGDSFYGFSWTPTEEPMPAGITAVDIAANGTGAWIQGDDDKLYAIGSSEFHFQLVTNGSLPSAAQTVAERSAIYEVTGWTSLGVGLASIPPGGQAATYAHAFLGTDGGLYMYEAPGSGDPFGGYAQTLRRYETIPGANLDYSSGVLAVIPVASRSLGSSGMAILTNTVLVRSNRQQLTTTNPSSTSTRNYLTTRYPVVDYIHFCYPFRGDDPDAYGGGSSGASDVYYYRAAPGTISGPPSGN